MSEMMRVMKERIEVAIRKRRLTGKEKEIMVGIMNATTFATKRWVRTRRRWL